MKTGGLPTPSVEVAAAHVNLAREHLHQTTLRAPFDGVVLDQRKQPEEACFAQAEEPVLLFADLSRLRVRAEIDEQRALHLKVGQPAELFGHNLGETRYQGRIASIKPIMGPKQTPGPRPSERIETSSRR